MSMVARREVKEERATTRRKMETCAGHAGRQVTNHLTVSRTQRTKGKEKETRVKEKERETKGKAKVTKVKVRAKETKERVKDLRAGTVARQAINPQSAGKPARCRTKVSIKRSARNSSNSSLP